MNPCHKKIVVIVIINVITSYLTNARVRASVR